MKSSVSVLMVCLGNICRSPLAETALRIIADRNGLDIRIDSAGTGHWHIGHPPDARAREVAGKLGGVEIGNLRARQVQMDDFYKFDHIIAMDDENLRYLNAMKSEDATAKLSLLLDYLPGHEGQSVADPYYGDDRAFEICWKQIQAASKSFAIIIAGQSGPLKSCLQ